MRLISKFVVGAAVAGACGYASAATITGVNTGAAVSRQGAQVLGTADVSVRNTALTVNIQDGYVNLDTMRFTSPSGASFASADATNAFAASFTCSAGTQSVVFNYTQASSTASTIVYTAGTPSATTSGMSCTIPSLGLRANSLTTIGNVTLAVEGRKASTAATFDTSAATTVLSVANQFTVEVSRTLNGIIDVSSGRLSFTGSDTDFGGFSSYDTFAFSVGNATTQQGAVSAAATNSMTLTLTAGTSFAFLQEPADQTGAGSCTVSLGTGQASASTTAGAITLAPTSGACNVLTVSFSTVNGGAYTVALGRVGAPTSTNSTVFEPQTYTAGLTMNAGSVSLASIASGTAAGTWTLNGTTLNIPYVPLSSSVNLQVFLANRSTQVGAVTFTAWNASGTSCTGTLGTLNANSSGSFGSTLRAALQACTGAGWSDASRAIVQILSTTPSASTEAHTGFSTADSVSRQVMINDASGRR